MVLFYFLNLKVGHLEIGKLKALSIWYNFGHGRLESSSTDKRE